MLFGQLQLALTGFDIPNLGAMIQLPVTIARPSAEKLAEVTPLCGLNTSSGLAKLLGSTVPRLPPTVNTSAPSGRIRLPPRFASAAPLEIEKCSAAGSGRFASGIKIPMPHDASATCRAVRVRLR